jgi:hypothetical protein
MAQFDSGVFGFLRGKIGTIVSRLRYGKVYVSAKPLKYKTKSDKVKLARKIFSRRQRLNSRLRKDKKIQAFWRTIDADGLNNNTRLMIRNQSFVEYERLLPGCGFTPISDNKVLVRNISISERESSFEFKLERANPKALEPPYDVFCVSIVDRIYINSTDGLIREKIISSDTKFVTIEEEPANEFIPVTINQNNEVRDYKYLADKFYVMVAAIKFNELKNKYEWSDTYFEELFNIIPEDKRIKWDEKKYKFED